MELTIEGHGSWAGTTKVIDVGRPYKGKACVVCTENVVNESLYFCLQTGWQGGPNSMWRISKKSLQEYRQKYPPKNPQIIEWLENGTLYAVK